MSEERPPDDSGNDGSSGSQPGDITPTPQFSTPVRLLHNYTDGRKPWDWKSKYDAEASLGILYEAKILLAYLALSLVLAAVSLMLSGQAIRISLPFNAVSDNGNLQLLYLTINCHVVAVFFVGWVGGTTFALKWLVHACATGKWHLDRRPWRLDTSKNL